MQLYGALKNYIRTLRNEAGLSQDDLAALLGLTSRQAVSLWEFDQRIPEGLELTIALELVLDEPLQAIFAGIAERIRPLVAARAAALLESATDKPSAQNADRYRTLARLARLEEDNRVQWRDAA